MQSTQRETEAQHFFETNFIGSADRNRDRSCLNHLHLSLPPFFKRSSTRFFFQREFLCLVCLFGIKMKMGVLSLFQYGFGC